MEEYEKIELRSEEVQEILGTPPSWIVRWGTTLTFLSLIVLGIVSWVVKYPDKIRAPISVTTTSPPVSVLARTTGYISRLLVKENDTVSRSQILAIISNPANENDVMRLDSMLALLQTYDINVLSHYHPNRRLALGEIQVTYSAFIQIFEEYSFKVNNNFDKASINQLYSQIKTIKKGIAEDYDNQRTTSDKLELEKKIFERTKQLYTDKLLSLEELQRARSRVYDLEKQFKDVNSLITAKELNINEINKQVLEIQQNTNEGKYNNYVRLIESLNQLRSAIELWKQNYLIKAPIDGVVTLFSDVWSAQQNVKSGDEILAVVPIKGDGMIGKVSLPIAGSGKVRENQRVVIKFDGYPYQQYGIVEGKVIKKALLPKNNQFYAIQVSLPNGLRTSYGLQLNFDQQMTGTAEIITEERRFIQRIFDKLMSAVKN